MYCSACGKQVPDDIKFCPACGTSLSDDAPASAEQAQAQPAGQAAQPALVAEGCVAAAWKDIKATSGWLKKVVLLCLVGIVPVLGFAVEGYTLRWSRDLSFGKRECLPKDVFKRREISTGFFAWLVRLAYDSAYLLVALVAIFLVAGLIGFASAEAASVFAMLLILAFSTAYYFFYKPLVNVGVLRMAVVDFLESGFNIGKTWSAFRKRMGQVIGASVVPPLLIGIVRYIVAFIGFTIVFAIIGVAAAAATRGMYGGSGAYMVGYGARSLGMASALTNPVELVRAIIGAGYGAMFLSAVVLIITKMLSTFSMMLVTRALGHWTARTAPEWAQESDDAADAQEECEGAEAAPSAAE